MERVLIEGILFETEEVPEITQETLQSFQLLYEDEDKEIRSISEGTRFVYNKKSKQVKVETQFLAGDDVDWEVIEEFVL
jgi:hypothetical protein